MLVPPSRRPGRRSVSSGLFRRRGASQRHHKRLAHWVDRRVCDPAAKAVAGTSKDGRKAPRAAGWVWRRPCPHGILPRAHHRIEQIAEDLRSFHPRRSVARSLGLRAGDAWAGCVASKQADAARGPPAVGARRGHPRLGPPVRRIALRRVSTTSSSRGRVAASPPRRQASGRRGPTRNRPTTRRRALVAARPQAVAVECRAHEHAVRENEAGGPVYHGYTRHSWNS